MSGLSDVEQLAAILHGTRITLSESCAVCAKARSDARSILSSAWMTERDAAIRDEARAEALAEALHPEFGYEWREPMPTPSGEMDDGGVIWRAVQQAKAEALAKIRALVGAHVDEIRALLDDQVSTQEKEK